MMETLSILRRLEGLATPIEYLALKECPELKRWNFCSAEWKSLQADKGRV